jgi:hypothetical protein
MAAVFLYSDSLKVRSETSMATQTGYKKAILSQSEMVIQHGSDAGYRRYKHKYLYRLLCSHVAI